MELFERGSYLNDLDSHFNKAENGIGHTIFLIGEAGIGKTSLVNKFVSNYASKAVIYAGACDSLFTPRPLGPLFDIAEQLGDEFAGLLRNEKDRSSIFTTLVTRLSSSERPVILIFEDIHWADDATLDLIKFLSRRIYHHRCLFLLTYRDDEVHSLHSIANLLGQLPAAHFSKVTISRFSQETVEALAAKKGYSSGKELFTLTGGNPFYVIEILLNDGSPIPTRVNDSILTVFRSKNSTTRALLEFLSILPSRIEPAMARRIEKDYPDEMDNCIALGIIVQRTGYASFKHELFRLTIERSLSPSKRKGLHQKMVNIMREGDSNVGNLSQLIHHAKYADERELVAKTAPQVAKEASSVGAHLLACKLYGTAIEYSDKNDPSLIHLYEGHAYECYLTNQIKTGIVSQQIVLDMWRQRKINLKIGDALRFLSRLWWFNADYDRAIALALEAIEVLENGLPTRERALAYSNLSQVFMNKDNHENTLLWGNKAIDLAVQMEDDEILCHALNNVGNVLLSNSISWQEGEEKLNQSLSIALKHGFQEHVARAYANLSTTFLLTRNYEKALNAFNDGITYCEGRDLNSKGDYMVSCKGQLFLEMGHWQEAERIALHSERDQNYIVRIPALVTLATLAMRKGKFEEARKLIDEAKVMATPTKESQRIIPVLSAELELAWISGGIIPIADVKQAEKTLFSHKNNSWYYSKLVYWMKKCGVSEDIPSTVIYTTPYELEMRSEWTAAAECWEKIGAPYEYALALFENGEENQRQALVILSNLGATATYKLLKAKLTSKGVRNIPRGLLESTRSNPAHLTSRQVEILELLQEGASNKEIAAQLFISAKTVDHHISAILSKLEVSSRSKAVLQAHKLGIIKK